MRHRLQLPRGSHTGRLGPVRPAPGGVEGQDEAGRLSNVLDPLIGRIRCIPGPGDALRYQVRVRHDNRESRSVTLKAVVAFDDDGWPCLRVSLPEED